MKILVLNAGSSSQKSCLYDIDSCTFPEYQPSPLWQGQIDGTQLVVSTSTRARQEETLSGMSHREALAVLLGTLWSGPTQVIKWPSEIDIVGHRVVHGGREYCYPTRITKEVKAAIHRLSPLAPAHNPRALEGICAVEQFIGAVPQVAVFDTAFHYSLPPEAAFYPGPYKWAAQGIRRYGFHGISHQDCAQRTARILGRDLKDLRLITCHLGNGCSLAAIRDGQSVDTSMGFTTLEGLMMGTRSGSIDPGILLYLMQEKGYDAAQVERILTQESGLKGVSGLSGDMRDIDEGIRKGNKRAQLAFDIYVHRLCAAIGSMLPTLGRLDALVFTAGIGEHSSAVRYAVCQQFGFLGLSIAPDTNETVEGDQDISCLESHVRVLVIKAQEDWAIAKECWRLHTESLASDVSET